MLRNDAARPSPTWDGGRRSGPFTAPMDASLFQWRCGLVAVYSKVWRIGEQYSPVPVHQQAHPQLDHLNALDRPDLKTPCE